MADRDRRQLRPVDPALMADGLNGDDAIVRPNRRSGFGRRSSELMFRRYTNIWSYKSSGSILSAFSRNSILSFASVWSIGSIGSILSIGSAGSVLSIGSTGSILSIGSAGSILSIGKAGGRPGKPSNDDSASKAEA